ncbi:TPA: hypothetical protein RFW79_000371 [Klebsiella pneumoniae subsp. pneumoniae]|uniref:hypothetical protein n=1 Tax=Klebsiella pneumoniae complex TaxID=3390273 RepID=UPI0018C9359D|nr:MULTISPECIES: hypothetical protein [Klebsiella]HDU4746804.1 hypothetical protein [Klebsiella pneumoniae subsp. pneumoniae]MBG9422529.1 hypothetical protein [Klebsiella pneumoniae]MBY5084375.1 hypothetical protein [Klebsiella pneumoniae]MBZ1572959.1 hypothetical protein [Klebsiella pneumoniae]MCQ0756848.1 hypothetical protein [Klebsiella pneumoniae]
MSYNLIPFPLDITPEAALKIVESNFIILSGASMKAIVQHDTEALEDIRSLSEQLTYIEHSLKAAIDGTLIDSDYNLH